MTGKGKKEHKIKYLKRGACTFLPNLILWYQLPRGWTQSYLFEK
jgi:hypothetical protein